MSCKGYCKKRLESSVSSGATSVVDLLAEAASLPLWRRRSSLKTMTVKTLEYSTYVLLFVYTVSCDERIMQVHVIPERFMGFCLANDGVILPSYDDSESSKTLATFTKKFPLRRVVQV